jgi:hypothetical protein
MNFPGLTRNVFGIIWLGQLFMLEIDLIFIIAADE